MSQSFVDKTVMVTGAAKGIGAAVSEAFLAQGANVVMLDKRWETSPSPPATDHSLHLRTDVSDGDAVRHAFEKTVAHFGTVDILINNAGISQPKPFLALTEDDWDRTLDANLKSVFLCCQQALRSMLVNRRGCIINMASELAYLGRAEFSPYAASKGAILSLTRSLAREFAPDIRINAVAPGPVDTDLLHAEINTPEQLKNELAIPLQRFASPQEIAATVLFLASEQASFYCGEVLSPNGGALMR